MSTLTRVILVMQSGGDDLKGTGEIQQVELRMQGEQNINRFVSHCRRLRCHLADWG